MGKLYAYADLPRTGLCNMLNVWARAFLWAKDHGAEMIAPQWVKVFRIGPWIRGERDKRMYINQFGNYGYIKGVKRWKLLHLRKHLLEHYSETAKTGIVVFSGQKHNLLDICSRRDDLRKELFAQAVPSICNRLRCLPDRFIAVHIRRGDFRSIGRTLPESYYIRGIRMAAEQTTRVPILVFSDAATDELRFLKEIGHDLYSRINIMDPAPALHDVLALSKASVFVCTNGSSFSEWAAFLGGMPTFWSGSAYPIDERKLSGIVTRI